MSIDHEVMRKLILPTQGLWFTTLNILSHLRFMWLLGQMQPNIGDSRRFVHASWQASLVGRKKIFVSYWIEIFSFLFSLFYGCTLLKNMRHFPAICSLRSVSCMEIIRNSESLNLTSGASQPAPPWNPQHPPVFHSAFILSHFAVCFKVFEELDAFSFLLAHA